jgi:hypothetical protein
VAGGEEGGLREAELPPADLWASHRSPPPPRVTRSPKGRPGGVPPPRPGRRGVPRRRPEGRSPKAVR